MIQYIFVLLFIFIPWVSSAQVLVADVALTVDWFMQTDERSYQVFFTIENTEGIQPGVQYAFILTNAEGASISSAVYDTIVLYESVPSTQRIVYTAPEDLGGEYTASLIVKTQDEFILVSEELGTVTLEGDVESVERNVFTEGVIENVRLLPDGIQVIATVFEESVVSLTHCGQTYVKTYTADMSAVLFSTETQCAGDVKVTFDSLKGQHIDQSVYRIPSDIDEETPASYIWMPIGILACILFILYRRKKHIVPLTLSMVTFLCLAFPFDTEAARYKETIGFSSQDLGGAFGCNVYITITGPGTTPKMETSDTFSIGYSYGTTDCSARMTAGGRVASFGPWVSGSSIGKGVSDSGRFSLRAPTTPGTYDIYVSGTVRTTKADRGEATKSYPSRPYANTPMFRFTVAEPASIPSPTVSLGISNNGKSYGSSTSVEEGEPAWLMWSSNDADGCIGYDGLHTKNKTAGTVRYTPDRNTTYTIECWNSGSNKAYDTASVSVTKIPREEPAPTATFSASPTSVDRNSPVNLQWGSTNAAWCTGWNFATGGSPTGTKVVRPNTDVTYGVTCWEYGKKKGRKATASQYVQVVSSPPSTLEPEPELTPPPAPSVTLEVRNTTQDSEWTNSNITISASDQIALRWESENATTCNGSNVSTGGANSGFTSTVIEPAAGGSIVYSVLCSGASDSLRVTVNATPPTMSVLEKYVRSGEVARLMYNAQGNAVQSCTLAGPSIETTLQTQTGTIEIPVYGDSVFTLNCIGGTAEVTVEIIPMIFDS